jgi:hypothetical protein
MHVVLLVTGLALTRRDAVLFSAAVAPFTGNPHMLALEGKVGDVVVEDRLVQPHDVGVTPDMFGMTELAFQCAGTLVAPVIPTLAQKIGGDSVVTDHAPHLLLFLGEGHVTLFTVALELGVILDDRPRHDEYL